MCYCVYIATNEHLEEGSFVPNETLLYFQKPDEDELLDLRGKFEKP